VKGNRLGRCGYERVDTAGAGAFAKDGDSLGVAPKGLDVAPDPIQGEALIEETGLVLV
jgi:hypothetical protein